MLQSPTMRILRSLLPLAVATAWWLSGCTPPEQKCSQDRVGNLEACQSACEKGDMPSCFAAAHTFDERFEHGAAGSDAEQAAKFYEKACEGGELEACDNAVRGLLLGPSRERPELPAPHSVENAPERRRNILAKACSLDDRRRCMEASDAYLGEEREKSEQLGRKACSLEFADRVKREACEDERRSLAKRAEQGAKGCESGSPGGCLTLGNAVILSDRARAHEAYAKECKRRRLLDDGKPDRCVQVYEQAAIARKLPMAQPSISDRPNARVMLRSLTTQPSKPEKPSPEHIREVIDRGTESLRACYAAALSRNAKLTGTLTLAFTIDGLGEPWNIREQELKLVDLAAVECVKKAATTWRFDEPNRGTIEVEAAFAFRLEAP